MVTGPAEAVPQQLNGAAYLCNYYLGSSKGIIRGCGAQGLPLPQLPDMIAAFMKSRDGPHCTWTSEAHPLPACAARGRVCSLLSLVPAYFKVWKLRVFGEKESVPFLSDEVLRALTSVKTEKGFISLVVPKVPVGVYADGIDSLQEKRCNCSLVSEIGA